MSTDTVRPGRKRHAGGRPGPGLTPEAVCETVRELLGANAVSLAASLPRGLELIATLGDASLPMLELHRARKVPGGVFRRRFANGSLVATGVSASARARRPEARKALEDAELVTRTRALEAAAGLHARLQEAHASIAGICDTADSLETLGPTVAGIIYETLGATMAGVFFSPLTPGELLGATRPARLMTGSTRKSLESAIRDPRNEAFLSRLDRHLIQRPDLRDGKPLSPLEEWLVARGICSLFMARARSGSDGNSTTVSLSWRDPVSCSPAEVAFLRHVASRVQSAVQRIRAEALVTELRERSTAQARLLDSLGQPEPLRSVAATFARELAVRLNIHCIAITHTTATGDGFGITWQSADAGAEQLRAIRRGKPNRRLARAAIRDGAATRGHAWLDARGERLPSVLLAEVEQVLAPLGALMGYASALARLEYERRLGQATTALFSSLGPGMTVPGVAEAFVAQVREVFGASHAFVAGFEGSQVRLLALESDFTTAEQFAALTLRSGAPLLNTLLSLPPDAMHYDDLRADARDPLARLSASWGLRSLLRAAIPGSGGSRSGMVVAASEVPRAWDATRRALLEDFAAALGLVLERARVTSALERVRSRRDAILGLISAIGPQDNVEQVATPVCSAIRSIYGATHCSIAHIDHGRTIIVGLDSDAFESPATLKSAVGDATFLERFQPRGYDLVPDIAALAERALVPERLSAHGLRSMLRVLIGSPESPLGIISVGSRAPGAFTERDATELREVARPMAVVISYFNRRKEADRRAFRLEVANRTLEDLSAGMTPEELASVFLRDVGPMFDSSRAIVAMFDPGETGTRILAASGPPDSELLPAEPIDTPGVLEPPPALLREGIHEGIAAPLVADNVVHGVVVLWRGVPSAEGDEESALLGTLARFLAVAIERAIATASLADSERRYRSLVTQAEEMILLFDAETLEILDANPYAERILGHPASRLQAMRYSDICADEPGTMAASIQRTIDEGEFHATDRPFRRVDGSVVTMDVVASMALFETRQAILVLGRDASERHLLQRRLLQGQKMEALGSMAGNIAHDFNNLLTTILGFAGLLRREPAMDEQAREHLGLIEDAARRAADLSQQMLSFARGGLVRFGPVDLGPTIEQTLRLAEASFPPGIAVRTYIPRRPVIVEGDEGQLQQALLNIFANARDAMPEGGTLTVRLRAAGDSCILSIADTGTGMDDETRMRLFEPFFTTKPPGIGTGLGMSIVYGIVQGHHGSIAATSAPGKGATFTIRLPLLDIASQPAPPPPASSAEGHAILVVDDDELVRRTLSAMLLELGYNVASAVSGPAALEAVRHDPEHFSAVVLDLVMPGMSGAEVFHELETIRPGLPVVVCTGYADDEHIDADVQRRAAGVIHKPFTPDRLARSLQLAGAYPVRRTP